MTNGTPVSLPDRVTLQLTAQDAVTILGALHDAGPYKTVAPIIRALEQQLMSQASRPPSHPYPVAPPIAPVPGQQTLDELEALDQEVAHISV